MAAPGHHHARGFIIWLTGLSGSGKTTIAQALGMRLSSSGPTEILDGDEIRGTLCQGLGYSKRDRDTNVYRIGFVARLLARNGVGVVVSAVSPYRSARQGVREIAASDGTPFLEVHLDAPLEVLIARDVKGMYKRALSGELKHFTGVSDPYEPPESPELRLKTGEEPLDVSLHRILRALEQRGLLDPPAIRLDDHITRSVEPPLRRSASRGTRGRSTLPAR